MFRSLTLLNVLATGEQMKRTLTLFKLVDFWGLNIVGNIRDNVSTQLINI